MSVDTRFLINFLVRSLYSTISVLHFILPLARAINQKKKFTPKGLIFILMYVAIQNLVLLPFAYTYITQKIKWFISFGFVVIYIKNEMIQGLFKGCVFSIADVLQYPILACTCIHTHTHKLTHISQFEVNFKLVCLNKYFEDDGGTNAL